MPLERPSSETTLHELLDALAHPESVRAQGGSPSMSSESPASEASCAVCLLVARSAAQSLRALFAEFVNDPQTRAEFRRARGFCREHVRLLESLGDALAIAILYGDLARLAQERWERGEGIRPARGLPWKRAARPAVAPCPGCEAEQEAEARYTGALAAALGEARAREALEAGPGLCTAHAEQVMARAAPAHADALRRLETERLAVLQAELEEIVRKNDYRFRGEPWGPEKDAWRRALRKLTRP